MTINPLYFFSLQIGDPTGEATAQMNLADLRRTLGVDGDGGCGGMGNSTKGHASEADDDGLYGADSKARRRLSMERMDLLKVCLCLAAFVALLFFLVLGFFFSASSHTRGLSLYLLLQLREGGNSTGNLPKLIIINFIFSRELQHGDFIIIIIIIIIIIVFLGPFQFWLLAL
jgi:hypothetical protein